MKKFLVILMAFLLCAEVSAAKNSKKKSTEVAASTSWTAAFADLAGIDEVTVIAPANLRHPPEYEVTVGDIQVIMNAKYFVYAGFERMMKTLGENTGSAQMLKVRCDNSIATVTKTVEQLSDVFGTKEKAQKRLQFYVSEIENGKNQVQQKGLEGARVYCNVNQIYLAKDLGFEIADTFGPGPVTSEQIAKAKNGEYAFIIDNVHNPVAGPLVEVCPSAKYVIWRNFPEKIERNALRNVVKENISKIF